jgi:hypothetical protein
MAGERRRVKVRVRGRHRSGSHPVSIRDSKARRRVKLVGLTLLAVGVTLGVSWCAAGRMTGDPSVPQVQEAPPA